MRSLFTPLALSLCLPWAALAASAGAAAPETASSPSPACTTAPGEPDWLGIVGPYPQPATLEGQSERFVLLWLQGSRTPADVARAQGENTVSLGCFADAIHLPAAGLPATPGGAAPRPFNVTDFPLTAAVLEHARQDFRPVLDGLKNTFARVRPYDFFQGLEPALPRAGSPSYPSTHAAVGVLFARILGQLDAADRPGLDAKGRLLGTDRVLGGVHYPSDVDAGARLGRAFATWWLDQPGHLKLLQTACCEWQ